MNTFFLYTILLLYYYLYIIYLLLTTYYNILLCFNELGVGSNMIFQCYFLTTLLFFLLKYTYAAYLCTGFVPVLHRIFTGFSGKIEKNMPIFCNFFSLCINDLREI